MAEGWDLGFSVTATGLDEHAAPAKAEGAGANCAPTLTVATDAEDVVPTATGATYEGGTVRYCTGTVGHL